ncbi:MAG: amino acid permease [Planctomycetota bacterium]|nr:MAG: amino acid permease [Planctomycetota bacterium]REK20976.1 MAG: amino acid permease [Planctomycetota bacterium]REK37242.1 MAG: amino acid permease [Planctomycetota bacterium]
MTDPSPSDAVPGPELPYAHTLPRLLGPFDAIALVVGSIIGSGIFLKVDAIAREMVSFGPIIAVWAAGGLAAMCGSLALAELSAMLPHAGGPYVYLRQAYGRCCAFLWGWTEFSVIRTGSLGSLACGTVIYFDRFLQALAEQGALPEWLRGMVPLSHFGQAVLTLLAVLLLSTINIVGTRWGAWMQNVTTVIKVAFLGFLICGPFLLGKAESGNFQPVGAADYGFGFWKHFGLAMVAVFWAYDGWINIGPVAEEIRDPQRNVPLGLVVGMLVIIAVYVLTIIGYHSVLPMRTIQATQTVAADAMGVLIGAWGPAIASLGVMVSTFGALNSNLLSGPRVYFAMARDGLFPAKIRQVHATFRTPAYAIAIQSGWSLVQIMLVFLFTQDPGDAFGTLTDFVILGGTVFYGLTVGAVMLLRFQQPDLERPYRTLGYPLTPLIYLVSVVVVVGSMIVETPLQVAAVGGLMAVGVGAYYYFRRGGLTRS